MLQRRHFLLLLIGKGQDGRLTQQSSELLHVAALLLMCWHDADVEVSLQEAGGFNACTFASAELA